MKYPLKSPSLWVTLVTTCLLAMVAAAPLVAAQKDSKTFKVEMKKGGWLGITMQNLSSHMAEALGLQDNEGVLIDSVMEDSPADQAGLEEQDVIVRFDGTRIEDTSDLSRAVRKTDPGDEAEVVVIRDGKEKKLLAKIAERDDEANVHFFSDEDHPQLHSLLDDEGDVKIQRFLVSGHGFLGVELQDISEQLGDYFGVADGNGVLISEVIEDSPAAEAGLKAGDVIVGIDDEEVDSSWSLREQLGETDEGDEVSLEILRDKRSRTFNVTLGESPSDLAWVGKKDIRIKMPRGRAFRWQDKSGKSDKERIRRRLPDFEWHAEKEDVDQEMEDMDEEMDDLKKEMQQLRQELRELKKELRND